LTKGFSAESCLQNTLVKREALWQSLTSLFFCLYSQVECSQALVKRVGFWQQTDQTTQAE